MTKDTTANYARLAAHITESAESKPPPKKPRRYAAAVIREKVQRRDGWCCVACGFSEVVDVHHIVPVAEGGTDELENLITLCPNHHRLADMGTLSRDTLRSFYRPSEVAALVADEDEDLSDILPGLSTASSLAGKKHTGWR